MLRTWWIFIIVLWGFYSCRNSSVTERTFEGPLFDIQICPENKAWEYMVSEEVFRYAQGLEGFASLTKEVTVDFTLEATFLIPGNEAGLAVLGHSDFYLLSDRDTIRSMKNDSVVAEAYLPTDQPIRLRMQRVKDRLQCWWAPSNDLFQLLSDETITEDSSIQVGLVCRGSGGFIFHQVSLNTAQNNSRSSIAKIERINMAGQIREVIYQTNEPIQNVQFWKDDSLVLLSGGQLFLLSGGQVDSTVFTLGDSVNNHNLSTSADYSVLAYSDRIQLLSLESGRLRNIPLLRAFVEGMVSPSTTEAILSGARRQEQADIYTYSLLSGRLNQVTDTPDTLEIQPRVHADSVTIFYTMKTAEKAEIWFADGSIHQPLLKGERDFFSPSLSPDGKWLAYLTADHVSSRELSLQVMDLEDPEHSVVSLAHFRGDENSLACGAWSNNSRYLYFLTF